MMNERTIQQHKETLRANMGIIQRTRLSINNQRAALGKVEAEFEAATKIHRAAIRDDLKKY